jgi:hypothetical protein
MVLVLPSQRLLLPVAEVAAGTPTMVKAEVLVVVRVVSHPPLETATHPRLLHLKEIMVVPGEAQTFPVEAEVVLVQ